MSERLETIHEVLHALGAEETIIDACGREVSAKKDVRNRNGMDKDYFYLGEIVLPCIIKKEPHYLYEWVWYEKSKATYEGFCIHRFVSADKPNSSATKTGRKFVLEDGFPKEITE